MVLVRTRKRKVIISFAIGSFEENRLVLTIFR